MAEPEFHMFARFSAERVATALTDTPVVMLIGPRQCGKTTLVRQFVDKEREYVTLDDDTVLEAARSDPAGFVRGLIWSPSTKCNELRNFCGPSKDQSIATEEQAVSC
jgi:ABC-type cobalamin/Fe3+-siderophores transport system ATPase subunit